MILRVVCILGLVIGGFLLVPGCDRERRVNTVMETDDSDYQRGKDFLRQGRNQEALAMFLRVIEKRGDGAPESHLDAGILYQEHIKDPIAAIYHYRKFRELRPNSPQADLVRQRIDAATREFARTTLPLLGGDGTLQRAELLGTMDRLKSENELLKAQLAQMQAGGEVSPVGAVGMPVSQQPVNRAPQRVEQPVTQAQQQPVQQRATVPGRVRIHVVVTGDTLSLIAAKYYGSRSRWKEIYEANRDVLPNERALKVGMELRIP